ncbi:VOC family protein [Sphingomonas sp. GCM10030256]|uniref:VOC family protein n=1 Tax=Sphingomonas sp. GCM10030256 TaxID=3273427 RepID=UPI003605F320
MKIDHITLVVSSLAASMPYYEALLPMLGFAKKREHIWTDNEGFFFQFRESRPDLPGYERYGPGMNHLGFSAPDVETVRSVKLAMSNAGFATPEIQHIGPATALFMKDPDGIRFEVTHTPPGIDPVD